MAEASTRNYKEVLVEALKSFKCCKDLDVERFLREDAIDFEKRGLATTYLLLNKSALNAGELKIDGYFSLTHKAVAFNEDVSKSKRGKVSGKKNSEMASFILIGQLAKYMEEIEEGKIESSEITGEELLNDAFQIISNCSDYIINRNIIVECKPIEKVRTLYKTYGFSDLQFDDEDNLHMMYLKLKNRITF